MSYTFVTITLTQIANFMVIISFFMLHSYLYRFKFNVKLNIWIKVAHLLFDGFVNKTQVSRMDYKNMGAWIIFSYSSKLVNC